MQAVHGPVVVIGEVARRWMSRVATPRAREVGPATLEEILAYPHWDVVDYDGRRFPVTVESLNSKADFEPLKRVRRRDMSDRWFPPQFLKFTCNPTFTSEEVETFFKPGLTEDPDFFKDIEHAEFERLLLERVSENLRSLLLEIVLAANIARFGSLIFYRVFQFVKDRHVSSDPRLGAYHEGAVEAAERRGWPQFQSLNVGQVFRWLDQVPGLRLRHSETRLGRALAAASHLLVSQQEVQTLDIVWALLGLEALYTRGNVGLQQQLMDKTEAYLGPRTTHKKDFAAMYDFRSRFLHGDVDLIYPNNQYTASEPYERFGDAMAEHEAVATAMLFASFQRMCADNRFELEFTQVVKPAVPPVAPSI